MAQYIHPGLDFPTDEEAEEIVTLQDMFVDLFDENK